MRQVPNYLLIGGGRLARHLQHYFFLQKIPFESWERRQPITELNKKLQFSTHVLILISDDAIESFIQANIHGKLVIHCSGSLITPHAIGAHPLSTFSNQLYDLATYQSIPFILDDDAPTFSELFPGLTNPNIRLKKEAKALYHALCVMSANFSCLLWQKLFSSFEQDLQIPAKYAKPLLLQQTQNLYHAPQAALTGPLARGDYKTIAKNLVALQGDPFQMVYQSFVDCYAKMMETLV